MPRNVKMPEKAGKKQKNSAKQLIVIDKTMRVSDILTLLPDSAPLLAQYGLSCFSCSANSIESLEQGCLSHGFQGEEIDDLITDLNEMLKDRPERPATLTLTEEAALALKEIMASQGKMDEGLLVGLDDHGGFCMEFQKDAAADEKIFQNASVPDVKIFATSLTLSGIGGSTIDFRDGRFKLDLPSDASASNGCACGGECSCGKH